MFKRNYQSYLFRLFIVTILNLLQPINAVGDVEISLTEKDLKNLSEAKNLIDLAIIGSGPAGLSAAMFAARRGIPTYVFKGPNYLGYLKEGHLVENIPGVNAEPGANVMKKLEEQAQGFGANINDDTINKVDFSVWPYLLEGNNENYRAKAVIVATGAKSKSLGVNGEDIYRNRGILSCGLCDAHLAKDQDIIIIGGGDCAAERVFQLLPYAKTITLLVRSDAMKAIPTMQMKIKEMPQVKILYNKEVIKFVGDGKHLTALEVLDKKTRKIDLMPVRWVFLSIGFIPNTSLVEGKLELDREGYIKVDFASQETNVPLVYAAGNVCDPSYKLAATCIGSATKAAFNACKLINRLPIDRALAEKIKPNAFVPAKAEDVPHIADLQHEQQLEDFIKNNKVALVDFYVSTCSECQRVGGILNRLAAKYKDKVAFIKVEDTKHIALSKQYDIQYVPTIMMFVNGTLVDKIQDQIIEQELDHKILDLANKYVQKPEN